MREHYHQISLPHLPSRNSETSAAQHPSELLLTSTLLHSTHPYFPQNCSHHGVYPENPPDPRPHRPLLVKASQHKKQPIQKLSSVFIHISSDFKSQTSPCRTWTPPAFTRKPFPSLFSPPHTSQHHAGPHRNLLASSSQHHPIHTSHRMTVNRLSSRQQCLPTSSICFTTL